MKTSIKLILILCIVLIPCSLLGHPGGNMVTIGKHVIWSYVDPIDDTEHHASVMIWSPNSQPKVLLKSKFPSSDFMFYVRNNDIYIIEQRYLQKDDTFQIRILKTQIGKEPQEIWEWFDDTWRIGDGGFFMSSDDEIIFGRYPHIYQMKKGHEPKEFFQFKHPLKKIRKIDSNKILLIGEDSCWLTSLNGEVLKTWEHIIDSQIDDAPLNRNQIFDADYHQGELLLAYWGNRSFDLIPTSGVKETILQNKEPFVPHWVSFYGKDKLLFSSKMLFNGETPKPKLILYKTENNQETIWTE